MDLITSATSVIFLFICLASIFVLIASLGILNRSKKTMETIELTLELFEAGVSCAASAKMAFKTNKNEQTMYYFLQMLDNYERIENKFRKSRLKTVPSFKPD